MKYSSILLGACIIWAVAMPRDALARIQIPCAGIDNPSHSWVFGELYGVMKTINYDHDGNVMKVDYAIISSGDRIGNSFIDPSPDGRSFFTYRIFNLQNNGVGEAESEVVVEFEYKEEGSFGLFLTPEIMIKKLPLDFGKGRIEKDGFPGAEEVFLAIEDASIVAKGKIDLQAARYCPDDKLTFRFAITDLPTNPPFGEHSVYAIGFPVATEASFSYKKEQVIRVRKCLRDDILECIRTSGNSVYQPGAGPCEEDREVAVYPSGAIIPAVEVDTLLRLEAVPKRFVSKEIFVNRYGDLPLAAGRSLSDLRNPSAFFEFSDGTIVDLPDRCDYVVPVVRSEDIGIHWAELKVKGDFIRVEFPSGKVIFRDENVVNVYGRWDWEVVAKKAAVLTEAEIGQYFPTSVSPKTNPIYVRPCTTLEVEPLEQLLGVPDLLITQDVYIEEGGSLIFPNAGRVVLTNGATMYVSGTVVFGLADIEIDFGSRIIDKPNRRILTAKKTISDIIHGPIFPNEILCRVSKIEKESAIIAFQSIFYDDGMETLGFQIYTKPGTFYMVEVATDNVLFNFDEFGHLRTDENYFNSFWGSSSGTTEGSVAVPLKNPSTTRSLSYYVPQAFWKYARLTEKIYYRLSIADDAQGTNRTTSTEDQDFLSAPFITVMFQGDTDDDQDVDLVDVRYILNNREENTSDSMCGEQCDIDGDGQITVLDARKAVVGCTRFRCATE